MQLPLDVTFYGPYVFNCTKTGMTVLVPWCDDHRVNLKTDMDDQPIYAEYGGDPADPPRVWTFGGPVSAGTATDVTKAGGAAILHDKWISGWPEDCGADSWKLAFKFPWPNRIAGLLPEYIKIMDRNRTVFDGECARALRFFYDRSDQPTMTADNSEKLQFDAKYLDGTASTNRYSVQFHHYNPVEIYDKNYPHRDAENCFRNTRDLLKPWDTYTVDFEKLRVHKESINKNGHRIDCGSSPLWFGDVGV